jgi:hypothetical protein
MPNILLAPEKEKIAEPVIDKSFDLEPPDFKVPQIKTSVWTTKIQWGSRLNRMTENSRQSSKLQAN